MLRFALVLLLLSLAGCDVFYGFVRHTEVGPGFDPEVLQAVVGQHPDSSSDFYSWDGEAMDRWVERGEAHVAVGYEDGHLSLSSMWTGRLPDQAVLDDSDRLQAELIQLLRRSFPRLPPLPDWVVERIRMNAQQHAAADGPSRRD